MTRTITTVEELDALPVGSVVLSRNYPNGSDSDTQAAFQKRGDGNWYRGARASWVHPDGFLPATILYPLPLPDRDQIARAIFDVHNRLGRSDYNGLPRETSLDAADAVIELLTR